MTVQELLNSIGETHNVLPESLKSLSIDQLIDMWDFFDETFKSEYRTIYLVCRSAKLSTIQTNSQSQILSDPTTEERINIKQTSTRPVAKRRATPRKTDRDPLILSDAAWALAHNTTINQVRENGLKLDDPKVLAYFQNGEDTLESVLRANIKDFKSQASIGKKSVDALYDWQEMIANVIDENRFDYNPNIAAAPTNFLNGHECRTLELNKIIGDNAPFLRMESTNRLLNALDKIGCVTIFDLFKSPLNIRTSLGVKSQSYDFCKKLMDDIRTNIDEYDNITKELLKNNEVVVYPKLLDENIYSLSLLDAIKITVNQLCDIIADENEQTACVVRRLLLENKSLKEVSDSLTPKKCPENCRFILQNFIDQMMKGNTNPILQNHYVSEELINRIDEIVDNSFYLPLTEFAKRLWVDDTQQLYENTRILHYILGIDILDCKENELKSFPYLYKGIDLTIPIDNKGDMRKDIDIIYKIMKNQIIPITNDDIYKLAIEQNPTSLFFGNKEAFYRFIDNYELFDHFGANPTTYRLKLTRLNWPERIASIIYDNQAMQPLSDGAIKELYSEATGEEYDYRGAFANHVFSKREHLAGRIIKDNNLWRYEEHPCPIPTSLYSVIHKYTHEKETFTIDELKEYLNANYTKTYSDATFRVYLYRCSVQAIDEPGVFCSDEAIERHPEHQWRNRFNSEVVNFSINIIHEQLKLAGSTPVDVKTLARSLMVAQSREGYPNYYSIEKIIRKYTTEDTNDCTMPFIVQRSNRKRELYINANAEISWNEIGLRKNVAFLQVLRAHIVQTLRSATNQELERDSLYNACKHLLDDYGIKDGSIIHTILYRHVSDIVETRDDGDKKFFKLLNIEEEVQEIPIENRETDRTKGVLSYMHPEPNKSEFTAELKLVMQSYSADWTWGNIDRYIGEFVDFLWESDSDRLDELKQYWYEFLLYKVDQHFITNLYRNSSVVYEKYLKLLYYKFTNTEIDWGYNDPIYGLGGVMRAIPCMNEFNRSRGTNIRKIYESLYKSRNNNSHGEDISQEIDLYMVNRDFLALYVYTYALMDAQI